MQLEASLITSTRPPPTTCPGSGDELPSPARRRVAFGGPRHATAQRVDAAGTRRRSPARAQSSCRLHCTPSFAGLSVAAGTEHRVHARREVERVERLSARPGRCAGTAAAAAAGEIRGPGGDVVGAGMVRATVSPFPAPRRQGRGRAQRHGPTRVIVDQCREAERQAAFTTGPFSARRSRLTRWPVSISTGQAVGHMPSTAQVWTPS